jgi:hypothetical protein
VHVPLDEQQAIRQGGSFRANVYITATAEGKSASGVYAVELRKARKGEP